MWRGNPGMLMKAAALLSQGKEVTLYDLIARIPDIISKFEKELDLIQIEFQ
jgi:hypothetical protein